MTTLRQQILALDECLKWLAEPDDVEAITDIRSRLKEEREIEEETRVQPHRDLTFEERVAELEGQEIECTSGIWTRKQLRESFELVQNEAGWKLAIVADVLLSPSEKGRMRDAIAFFTGGEPAFETLSVGAERTLYRVTAPGYYACVGA